MPTRSRREAQGQVRRQSERVKGGQEPLRWFLGKDWVSRASRWRDLFGGLWGAGADLGVGHLPWGIRL